jgi:4-hydroxybenzoate polyprenyltransferase
MATDIQKSHFLFKTMPKAWHPYLMLARLDRPIGTWLLLLPCWWSLTLAAGGIVHLGRTGWLYALLFALGALIMRGAGCVINDLWDRKLDAAVARTQHRPLAAGAVTPVQALLFLASLLLAGLIILLQFNVPTIVIAICSLALVIAYPLMKRVTWWPQLFLGFTFNWGALVGWSAVTGTVGLPALLLYVGGIFWTLSYDTIYAHQDKEDDALVGIKSTARLFAEKSKKWVGTFFMLALAFFAVAKMTAVGTTPALALMLLPAAHAAWQVKNWDMDNNHSSLGMFKANRDFGLLLLLALAV